MTRNGYSGLEVGEVSPIGSGNLFEMSLTKRWETSPDSRWWFESLLVHSGVSSATRRKATGADQKKETLGNVPVVRPECFRNLVENGMASNSELCFCSRSVVM